MINKYLIRFLVFISILVVSNYIYKYTQWPKDQTEHANLLDSLNNVSSITDILYLSSSSNYFCPKSDTSKKWISEYLNDFYPKKRVNAIHKGYMHAGVFLSILQNIPETSPIETIIISVNLRSFGAYWIYSDVETSYSSQMLMMNYNYPVLLRRFLLSLDYYDNKSKEERKQQFLKALESNTFRYTDEGFPYKNAINWDTTLAQSGKYLNPDGSWDLPKSEYACNLVKAFAFELDSLNSRITDLDKIVKYCNKRNWNLLFHILPEDIGNTGVLIGDDLNRFISNSSKFVFDRYKSQGVNIINNYNILDESFFYETYPTEHYIAHGKFVIAKSIAQQLKQYHSEHFKNIKSTFPRKKTDKAQANIDAKIQIIISDSIWYQNVKNKALENNRTLEEQLELDAKWLIDNP
jgi:hypothetical protein